VITIRFEGRDFECRANESVLECMTRHGVTIPSSCQSGACQTCMIRALSGTPTPESQQGLKDTLKAQGYFLACMCRPTEDMEIGLASVSPRYSTRVVAKQPLNESVLRICLARPDGFAYKAGQFINLVRPSDELTRSYSLASLPEEETLELHIKRVPDGRMSGWVFDALREGDEVAFHGPAGDCFYLPGNPQQPILLVGTGTGLAPLYGILRDALRQGHAAPIYLYHGSLATAGLYLQDRLRALAAEHERFHYIPCVLHGPAPADGREGDIVDLPMRELGSLNGYRVYLCGDPALVNSLRQKCFLAGASMQQIHADPFVFTPKEE